jgi:hypothetical protein
MFLGARWHCGLIYLSLLICSWPRGGFTFVWLPWPLSLFLPFSISFLPLFLHIFLPFCNTFTLALLYVLIPIQYNLVTFLIHITSCCNCLCAMPLRSSASHSCFSDHDEKTVLLWLFICSIEKWWEGTSLNARISKQFQPVSSHQSVKN